MLRTRDLAKSFGARVAVQSLCLEVGKGEVVGLLGPNGAGKTTSLSMISGIVEPSSGTVFVDGIDASKDRRGAQGKLGIAPQDVALYEQLTAQHNLEFFGSLYGLKGAELRNGVEWALTIAGLTRRAKERVSTFSGGMKRRLNLACAVVHRPRAVVLDEPTVGVDPQSRNLLFEVLRQLSADGMAILYASHYLEEVERLCDRVYILDRGAVISEGRVAELLTTRAGPVVEVKCAEPLSEGVIETLAGLHGVRVEGPLRVLVPVGGDLAAVFTALQKSGAQVVRIDTEVPTLESVFLDVTGRNLRDG